jgi:hypothetical protein
MRWIKDKVLVFFVFPNQINPNVNEIAQELLGSRNRNENGASSRAGEFMNDD